MENQLHERRNSNKLKLKHACAHEQCVKKIPAKPVRIVGVDGAIKHAGNQ